MRSLMPVLDTTATRKKKLWKTVFEGFDKIDGVPTPAEREVRSDRMHACTYLGTYPVLLSIGSVFAQEEILLDQHLDCRMFATEMKAYCLIVLCSSIDHYQ